ncbi:MAG TPA: zinc-ribbon domain-containing protein [Oscillospiraceae bacterium]|nr:zinc-ribbon domain-containing protein [Oscillospiraceae bacterium]HPK35194.1 zinc-ribbon domain-containing protein [Oscillospiraceae bacterium]HPR74997.1 zinc-ribbon domain-containing protein [Oscillospiraceae bacterium]
MPFCGKCGAEVPEGTKFCGVCGAEIAGGSAQQAAPTGAPVGAPVQTDDVKDVTENKWMGILAYFGPLVFIPMFAAKNSKFARFHTVQGFNLFLLWIAYTVLFSLLGLIKVTRYVWGVPYMGTPAIINILSVIVSLGITALAIIGIVFAAQGKKKELPVIGKLHILDSFMKPSV